tara:strand:+ start:8669 stop:9256 length:588 start_codon:yes stop_codon:yes gene_type:complete
MNLIFEDNIDFYKELEESSDEEEENICLLSGFPLDENKITLPCNHSFNFYPLYKEIYNQKYNRTNYKHHYVYTNQIKCPYCRQITNRLLPHVLPNNNMSFHKGVNTPEKYCMPFHTCTHLFKSGANKGNMCSKAAYYKDDKLYCKTHHNLKLSRSKKTINICKKILKSGARKGEQCGCKVFAGYQFCKRHLKDNV